MKRKLLLPVSLFLLALTGVVACQKDSVNVTEVKLDNKTLTLEPGKTATLAATVLPDNATDKSIEWKSSDEKVATVNNGVVTAVTDGTATITAISKSDGTKKDECVVTVTAVNVPVTAVTFDTKTLLLGVKETAELKATVTPDKATDPKLIWTSSDENFAQVDQEGKVTAIAVGEATITATSNSDATKKAECVVTVIVPVTEVKAVPKEITIKAGKTMDLVITVFPEDATDKTVACTSSDDTVATVSENGTITGVKEGNVTITVTSNSDKSKKAECHVTVLPATIPVTGITLDPVPSEIKVGQTLVFKGKVLPEGADEDGLWGWLPNRDGLINISDNNDGTCAVEGVNPGETNLRVEFSIDGQTFEESFPLTVKAAE